MKKYTVETNGIKEEYIFDYVAKQAESSVLLRVKDTVILATLCRDKTPAEEDFLPLSVQYLEKSYAVGKIPGGFVKRETKPSEHEILTARIIDRTIRPLFPKIYHYPTQVVVMVLSHGKDVDLQVCALNAAAFAVYKANLGIINVPQALRIGRIDDKFILNPTPSELKKSTLDLFITGCNLEILMIEMRTLPSAGIARVNMNELNEEELIEAVEIAQMALMDRAGKIMDFTLNELKFNEDLIYSLPAHDEDFYQLLLKAHTDQIIAATEHMAKSERSDELLKLIKELCSLYPDKDEQIITNCLYQAKSKILRDQIINTRKRPDGRALNEVRPIDIETNILPQAHGSCLFTRGQTQALAIATLGGDNDAQTVETIEEKLSDRFMFNYNFPGFCVGETTPLKAPSRRELGHANLAKRAILPSLPLDCPHSIRIVSEILQSNGSSSMASVCAGSLALRAAGIQTAKLVAGVAMGLMQEGHKIAVLTDITGLEDHDGDMDFKVAGTQDGITAMQMDIKINGLDTLILRTALNEARKARLHILDLLEKADSQIIINEKNLPKLECFLVEPSRVVEIIGQGGKTIREIIEKYDVSIDLEREKGEVKIIASSLEKAKKARAHIEELMSKKPQRKELHGAQRRVNEKKRIEPKNIEKFKIGTSYLGLVKSVLDFGCFIEIESGVDGLLHSSKINEKPRVGDKISVKIRDIKNGKISLDLDND